MGRLWRRYSKARGGRDRRLLRVIPADARTRTCSPCCVVVALGGATGTAHPRAGSAGRARPSRSLAHIQATQVARTESTRAPSRPIKSLSGDAKPQVASAVKPRKTRNVHAWKRTEPCVASFDGPIIDVALVACGLSSTLFFSQNATSRSKCDITSPLYQSLPLNVKYIVDIKSDLTSLACANGTNVAKYGDLVALVWDLKTKKRSVEPFQVHGMELTMPCLRETVMNVHNLGDLLPVEATASGSLFVRTQIEFVGLTKPTFVVVEMTPVHAHSDHSHTTVARDFFNIGYYTHVTERVSSAFCGDMTDQTRWILFGHKFPGPSFGMLSYCNKSYSVGFGALGDIDDVPPSLWQ